MDCVEKRKRGECEDRTAEQLATVCVDCVVKRERGECEDRIAEQLATEDKSVIENCVVCAPREYASGEC